MVARASLLRNIDPERGLMSHKKVYDYYGTIFRNGDKVRFHGLKAKISDFDLPHFMLHEPYTRPLWMVPIIIKGSHLVTFAHAEALERR